MRMQKFPQQILKFSSETGSTAKLTCQTNKTTCREEYWKLNWHNGEGGQRNQKQIGIRWFSHPHFGCLNWNRQPALFHFRHETAIPAAIGGQLSRLFCAILVDNLIQMFCENISNNCIIHSCEMCSVSTHLLTFEPASRIDMPNFPHATVLHFIHA